MMLPVDQEDFLNYNMANDYLDQFFGKFLNSLDKYKYLWKVMQIVFFLTLSIWVWLLGTTKASFSINKEMVIENLEAESLCSRHLVYDYIKATPRKEIHEIEIGNKMLLLCKSASSRYKLALEENWKIKNVFENDRKRQMVTEEVENIKRRHMEVQSCITVLNKDID